MCRVVVMTVEQTSQTDSPPWEGIETFQVLCKDDGITTEVYNSLRCSRCDLA